LGGDRRGGAFGDENEETGEEEHDPRGRARRGGRRPAGSSVAGGSCQAGRRLAGGICFQASSAAGGTCFPAEVEVEASTTLSPLSFSSAAARGFFPRLELCARALARGAILSRAMARVARLARFRAA